MISRQKWLFTLTVSLGLLWSGGCGENNAPNAADQTGNQNQNSGQGSFKRVPSGATGEGYGNDPYTAPMRALVRTKNRIDELQLKQYRALIVAHGEIKDTDEFMREIIEKNNLQLPDPPAGSEYHFNSEKQELEFRPRTAATDSKETE